jgi:tRNA U34 2-thiouridine synthase MnmA/TrmU
MVTGDFFGSIRSCELFKNRLETDPGPSPEGEPDSGACVFFKAKRSPVSQVPQDRHAPAGTFEFEFFKALSKRFDRLDMMKQKRKAIALLSGGLDSILAVRTMLDLGFEVIALNMKTPFCTCDSKGRCYSELTAKAFGIPIRRIYGGEDYLEIVKRPRHGYGKNVNPCIDCRIFLFSRAKKVMEEEGADFVFTGEVLGERPMSQRREAMNLIERESGLRGRVLRPLTAKLLEPTIMEREGMVDRNRLLDIKGRSRKPQLAIAERYQIDFFPCPAGGCLLTDQSFACKVRESFEHGEDSLRHMTLLKVGRHFRAPTGAKMIVGRNQEENETLMGLALPAEPKLTAHEHKSAYLLLLGEPGPENEELAARICARYSDGKDCGSLPVRVWIDSPSEFRLIESSPLDESLLGSLRVEG